MRQELEQLDDKLVRSLDEEHISDVIYIIRDVLRGVLEILDKTMAVDKSDDI